MHPPILFIYSTNTKNIRIKENIQPKKAKLVTWMQQFIRMEKEEHVTYFLHSAMYFLYASTTKTAQN